MNGVQGGDSWGISAARRPRRSKATRRLRASPPESVRPERKSTAGFSYVDSTAENTKGLEMLTISIPFVYSLHGLPKRKAVFFLVIDSVVQAYSERPEL